LELADVVRAHRGDFVVARRGRVSFGENKVLDAVERCRTAALGGHVGKCNQCGHEEVSYNSCRNRHCPKCLTSARDKWLAAREEDLLPVPYFHVVFTIPHELSALTRQNKRRTYGFIFEAAWETLRELSADPKYLGAEIGVLAVLHTWGQNLQHHPHVHCVVTGGGLALDGQRWVSGRESFFLPVRVLSRLFRGKFLDRLKRAHEKEQLVLDGSLQALRRTTDFNSYLRPLYSVPWFVYAKPPFGGPEYVLKYLARYTHRVAIGNGRLVALEEGRVTFRWKDYAHGCRRRVMSLSGSEFLRRFLLHLLPRGFKRIRQYGILANRCHREKISRARRLLAEAGKTVRTAKPATTISLTLESGACPACGSGRLQWTELRPGAHLAAPAVCDTS
jgi:hypothetical protein